MIKFRNLLAEEIECRVQQINEKGLVLLLYKNARCDMNILDETVGAENWQREHYECKGNLFCRVGININYVDEGMQQEYVWKADCGTESNTEKEKGEASDSFKRACVNWGIGRELYTAPAIWIECNDKEWNDGKPYVDFRVSHIAYKDREISELEIVDKNGTLRYQYGTQKRVPANRGAKKPVSAPAQEETKKPKIFCPEDYPVAWNSAVKRAKETGDITRLDIEDRGFTVTPENWERFTQAINS